MTAVNRLGEWRSFFADWERNHGRVAPVTDITAMVIANPPAAWPEIAKMFRADGYDWIADQIEAQLPKPCPAVSGSAVPCGLLEGHAKPGGEYMHITAFGHQFQRVEYPKFTKFLDEILEDPEAKATFDAAQAKIDPIEALIQEFTHDADSDQAEFWPTVQWRKHHDRFAERLIDSAIARALSARLCSDCRINLKAELQPSGPTS